MLRCSRGLRLATSGSATLEAAASAIVTYLYAESAGTDPETPQCALIRFYKTMAFADLDSGQQAFARSKLHGADPVPDTRVLTLLATVGDRPEWCDPSLSVGHRAIPLPSVEIVEQAPMISELIRAMGFAISDVISPRPQLLDDSGKTYNVFHVEKALASEFIPVQDNFVKRFGIESVVGFGGLLSSGEFFAVVMFSKVRIPSEPAGRFRNVALDVKAILHPFASASR